MTDDEAAEIEEQLSVARRLVEVAGENLALVRAEPAQFDRGKRMRYVIEGLEAGAVQLSAISSHLKNAQPARPALEVIQGGGEAGDQAQGDQASDEENATR